MDIEMLWRIIDEGSTPVIAIIAFLIWKLDKTVGEYMAAMKAEKKSRDEKLKTIHDDIGSMIRRIAGMNGSSE